MSRTHLQWSSRAVSLMAIGVWVVAVGCSQSSSPTSASTNDTPSFPYFVVVGMVTGPTGAPVTGAIVHLTPVVEQTASAFPVQLGNCRGYVAGDGKGGVTDAAGQYAIEFSTRIGMNGCVYLEIDPPATAHLGNGIVSGVAFQSRSASPATPIDTVKADVQLKPAT